MFETPQIKINQEILTLIARIDYTKGYYECLNKFQDINTKLCPQKMAAASSNAVLRAMKSSLPADTAGYVMALNWILTDYASIELCEQTIDKLYNMAANKPAGSKIEKCCTENDEEYDDSLNSFFGNVNLYEDTKTLQKPDNSPKYKISDLTAFANKAFDSFSSHPLLVISVFCAAFLNLQAYPSANSRLSRLLTILLLLKNGYNYVSNISFDSVLEKHYSLYEPAYNQVINEENVDYCLWNTVYLKLLQKHSDEFLTAVKEICEPLEECPLCEIADDSKQECPLCEIADEPQSQPPVLKLGKKPSKANKKSAPKLRGSLPPLQSKIIKLFSKQDKLTISEVVKSTKGNLNTVKKHLAAMVESKLIEKHGKTRGAWYTIVQ